MPEDFSVRVFLSLCVCACELAEGKNGGTVVEREKGKVGERRGGGKVTVCPLARVCKRMRGLYAPAGVAS